MSRWFRFYSEALDDPKVQKLDGDTFKVWVNLLCLANRNGGFLPTADDIAFALRLDGSGALAVVERLLSATLLDKIDGGVGGYKIAPHAWQERQYKSDTSTGRVKRFRERSKTVTETAPDTDTDTDVTLAKANGASADSDQIFWANAKAFLAPETKGDPGKIIGAWNRDYGKEAVANALTRAQLERPAQRIPFVVGCLRRAKANDDGWGMMA